MYFSKKRRYKDIQKIFNVDSINIIKPSTEKSDRYFTDNIKETKNRKNKFKGKRKLKNNNYNKKNYTKSHKDKVSSSTLLKDHNLNFKNMDLKNYILALHGKSYISNTVSVLNLDNTSNTINKAKNKYNRKRSSKVKKSKNVLKRYNVPLEEINTLEEFIGKKDKYLTPNTILSVGGHKAVNVKKLNAAFVDLDYYHSNMEVDGKKICELNSEEVYSLIKNNYKNFYEPSFVIDSGRGLYMFWLLEETFATNKSRQYWTKLQRILNKYFCDFGADARVCDCSRVLRIPGSINSKTGKTVRIINNPAIIVPNYEKRYTIRELVAKLLEDKNLFPIDYNDFNKNKTNNNEISNTRGTSKKNKFTLFTLHNTRAEDLEKLVTLRRGDCEGTRNNILFLYSINLFFAGNKYGNVKQKTEELNDKFKEPLSQNEIKSILESSKKNYNECFVQTMKDYFLNENNCLVQVKSGGIKDDLVKNGAYVYSNRKIIEDLNITQDEQKELKTIIGKKEKQIRKARREDKNYIREKNKKYYEENKEIISINKKYKYDESLKNNGEQRKKEKIEERRVKVRDLINKGLSNRQIQEELCISASTLNRDIKHLYKPVC